MQSKRGRMSQLNRKRLAHAKRNHHPTPSRAFDRESSANADTSRWTLKVCSSRHAPQHQSYVVEISLLMSLDFSSSRARG